ncbi:LacI family DNA-binding transcriptional regulator [Gorillibacterium sp. sgz5001074]|uniref:LacI family DNA-binding transcriptional regulator n=1 Tax=Gorillibacterium sp. sgz5001074 TaxID=3446695 RepID=UPI003F67A919
MSVTIKDIARLAQVSHTTVSRALNDSPLINSETKEKIKQIAEEMGYTPNFSAKSLVMDRSYNIGLFFSTLATGTSAGFFYETVRGVNSVIKEGYNMVVRGIDDYEHFRSIHRKSFDGVIVMSQSSKDDPFLRHLGEAGIPHIVLNRRVDAPKGMNILSDDCQGAYKAVEHLIRHGHRRIAIIEGKEGFQSTAERKEGYLKAMTDHGIPCEPEYQAKGNYDLKSGYNAMRKLLKLEPRPTAVFCQNDDMAVGAMKAIAEERLDVPGDISVVGFDDSMFSAFLSPALTTVKRPIEEISRQGAMLLLESIENKQHTGDIIHLNTELVVRESVRKPPAQ